VYKKWFELPETQAFTMYILEEH